MSDELRGEKIDVIRYAPDLQTFISNALAPAKVLAVELFEDDGIALVTVPDHQLSLAIGREGQNVRLAARLTGWRLDITSDSEAAEAPRPLPRRARSASRPKRATRKNRSPRRPSAETEEGETALTIDDELLRRLEEFKREQFGSE